VYTDALEQVTGKPWILRTSAPIEFSPLRDAPPFPREMISITPLRGVVDSETAVALLRTMMEPLLWAGSIRHELIEGHSDCAVVEVVGNPLTGPVLFIVRAFRAPLETLVLIYEVRGEERLDERDALLDAIVRLPPPAALDREIAQIRRAPAPSEELPLAALFGALGAHPIAAKLQSALQQTDVIHQYVLLATCIADVLCAPDFVETMPAEAFAELVRVLEGISSIFIRAKSDTAAMFAASLLARGLLLHSASNAAALGRALQLSALLIDKARAVNRERWEEALFSNLFARVSLAVRRADEDYGHLTEIAKALSSDEGVAYRVVTRLVNDDTFIRALKEQSFSQLRLARCDIALAVMQQMELDPSALTRGLQEGRHPIDPAEFLEIYRSLPREFALTPTELPSSSQVRFFETFLATYSLAFWELERVYNVDVNGVRASVSEYLSPMDSQRTDRILLFLRGFRSSKRIWMDNRFSYAHEEVIPFAQEPARLSIEAALTKGLSAPFAPIALGGLSDPLGMARIASVLDPVAWKDHFNMLCETAAVILVLPDYSDALTWELNQLIDRGYLGRVVLLMTPRSLDPKATDAWVHVAKVFRQRGKDLVPYREDGAFVALSNNGTTSEVHEFSTLLDGSLAATLSRLF
jgi:hypothetical protein